ncbi:MAG TPA: amylo-alpha-1,6-glucosidase [Candidatus Methylacidiphilales bacterium]|nr:amylo-alpha-1,6-glucosidase [Candidatus Methylacidiphilales bacterium]
MTALPKAGEHPDANTVPYDARYVWRDDTGAGRNVFAIFVRRLNFSTSPISFPFHLFADSLYRLRVNGRIVGFGPARFLPEYPEYDSYDLAPWLHAGENTVMVEVNSRGAPCYQAIQSKGGFIAWGGIHEEIPRSQGTYHVTKTFHVPGHLSSGIPALQTGMSTPGAWLVAPGTAWDPDAEPYSFAQGPIEILDCTQLPAGYPLCLSASAGTDGWAVPTLIAHQSHWGKLSSRAIAMPSMRRMIPLRIITLAPIRNGHVRHGFNAGNEAVKARQPFFTHIFSPIEQEADIGVFWGPLYLNGQELKHITCTLRGNRQNTRVSLRAGWNFLYGTPELLRSAWNWLMEFPDNLGLRLSALPIEDPAGGSVADEFAIGPNFIAQTLESLSKTVPSSLEEVKNFPTQWRMVPGNKNSPARELAWDIPGPCWTDNTDFDGPVVLQPPAESAGHAMQSGTSTLVLDFGGEYLGHASIEFECLEATIVDIGYDERLDENGTISYYRCNPFINSADRFKCAPGRHTLDAFHERGGRYLQITFRQQGPAPHTHAVTLHSAAIVQTTGHYGLAPIAEVETGTPILTEGWFRCSDKIFNWTWTACVDTLCASMADGWIDPWRERGMYIGDTIVEAAATRKFTSDTRLEAWSIRLWARGQFANGQIPDVVPSAHQDPLCDYSLLWIVLLRNYWAATADSALVREVWPVVDRIFGSSVWLPSAEDGGLWETHSECFVFVDWGHAPDERKGVNAVLNAFRLRALECSAELATAIGLSTESTRYRREADSVRAAFSRIFWDDEMGRFAACKLDGALSLGPAMHANALALAYRIATPAQEASVIAYLREGLQRNLELPPGWINFYFFYYLFDGLYQAGKSSLVEEAIRSHYGLMLNRGAWTLWENLSTAIANRGSLCHGWTCSPMIYFSEHVLGVRPVHPGDDTHLLIAPESDTLDWAEGAVPHRLGVVEVSWRAEGRCLHLRVDAPVGVRVTIKPAGRLGQLQLERVGAEKLSALLPRNPARKLKLQATSQQRIAEPWRV